MNIYFEPNATQAEQVLINKKNIEELSKQIVAIFHTNNILEQATTTIPITDTDYTNGGDNSFLMDTTGKIFRIKAHDETNLLLEFYCNLPQGAKGEQGIQGEPGPQGAKDEQGIQGEPGPQGATGIQGPQGIRGEKGEQGPQGPQGVDGPAGYSYYFVNQNLNENSIYCSKAYIKTYNYEVKAGDILQCSYPGSYGIQFNVTSVVGDVVNIEYIGTIPSKGGGSIPSSIIELSGDSGTLSQTQLDTLQQNLDNKIRCDNELYYLNDDQTTAGYIVYTHTGQDTSKDYFIKCITITISTKEWVKLQNVETLTNVTFGSITQKINKCKKFEVKVSENITKSNMQKLSIINNAINQSESTDETIIIDSNYSYIAYKSAQNLNNPMDISFIANKGNQKVNFIINPSANAVGVLFSQYYAYSATEMYFEITGNLDLISDKLITKITLYY